MLWNGLTDRDSEASSEISLALANICLQPEIQAS
jgi:hypothetical protein